MCSMEEIYLNFMTFLKANDKDDVLSRNFHAETSLESMFETIWLFPESKSLFRLPNPNPSMYKKGYIESNIFREQGNRLYKEGKLDKALEAYNYSILSGPFSTQDIGDKNCSNSDKECNNAECLSLGYANRSAVLFEMGQTKDAILDIDRAIKYGYMKTKVVKLYERKAKCFMKQGQFEPAIHILKMINTGLTSKNGNYVKHIEELINACVAKDNGYLKKPNNKNYTNLFYTGPPKLSEPQCFTEISCNGKRSRFSDAIKVQYTPSKGRHLVANRNITPGEVLLTEDSQCSMVTLDTKQRIYCCNCLRRAPIVLPCSTCSLVVFCSDECQKLALSVDGVHRKECALLPILICMKTDVNVALAFRAICSYPLSEIIKTRQQNDSPVSESTYINLNYNYETFYNLEGNRKVRNKEAFLQTAVNAVLLVKVLLKSTSFFDVGNNGIDSYVMNNRQIIYLLGGHIMRLILNIQCNSHCTKELIMSKSSVESIAMETIGYSVFCMLTLVNHSCVPNVFTSNLGNKKLMFAVSCISAGNEICDSYGERYVSHDKNLRRNALQETYYFQCNCIACQKDWPLFPDLLTELVNKPDNEPQCENTCQDCSSLNRSMKSKKKKKRNTIKENKTAILEAYNNARHNLMSGKTLEDISQNISNFIIYVEKRTMTPNKPLIEAQENMLRLFDLYGSQLILN